MKSVEVGATATVNLGAEFVELSLSYDALGLLMLNVRTTTRPIVMEIERREGREYKAMWPCVEGRWMAAGMVQRLWVGGAVAFEIGDERLRLAVIPDEPAGVRVRVEIETLARREPRMA